MVLACLVLLLSGCAGTAPPTPSPTPTSTGPAVIAYAAVGGVYVASADGSVRRLHAVDQPTGPRSSGDSWSPRLSWSRGGRHLAWTHDTFVYLADADGGQLDRWPCACDGAGFVGDSLVSVAADGSALYAYQQGLQAPRRVPIAGLPRWSGNVTIVAGSATSAVVSVTDRSGVSAYGGPTPLYAVGLDGRARSVRGGVSDVATRYGAASPDGRFVAFSLIGHGGACSNYGFVEILDLDRGQVHQPILPDLGQPTYVLGTDWSADGSLHIATSPSPCDTATAAGPGRGTVYPWQSGSGVGPGVPGLGRIRDRTGSWWSLVGDVDSSEIGAAPRTGDLVLLRPGQADLPVAGNVTELVARPAGP